MTEPKIAVTLYTCRDYTKTPADIAATMKKVKSIGYDYVQLSALGPIDPAELKKILDGEGLKVAATHTSLDRLRDDLLAVIDEHLLWGCRHVAIGSLPMEYRKNNATYAAFAKEGSEIGRKLAEHGLTFSYHNHHFELTKENGRTALEALYEESDPDVFFAEIDTYWIQYGGGDPAEWIAKMKGRVPVLHFKDLGVVGDKQVMAEVGEGNLNWPRILQAARDGGTEFAVVEQDTDWKDNDPFASIAVSYRNMKAMGLK